MKIKLCNKICRWSSGHGGILDPVSDVASALFFYNSYCDVLSGFVPHTKAIVFVCEFGMLFIARLEIVWYQRFSYLVHFI